MEQNHESWIEHLVMVGETSYYEEHRKILDETYPDGRFSSDEWNEASAGAIIKAVAAMIEANNTALLAEIECMKENP